MAGLIGDLTSAYGQQLAPHVSNQAWIKQLFEHVIASGENEAKEIAMWAKGQFDQITKTPVV